MLKLESLRDYCLAKKAVTEEFPFDEETLVFKVKGKMFALTSIMGDLRVNLKCKPEKALELRASYPDHVLPGYHMNKKHWNTVVLDGGIEDGLVFEWIDHSYDLVVAGLPKKLRGQL